MKALLRKELRESIRPGVLGLIICGLLLLSQYLTYEGVMKDLALGQIVARGQILQPLGDPAWHEQMGFFCAIFAALLGWLQVVPERRRGLWEFLVHRPTTPTAIFLAKAITGLAVYFAATGLPLVWFIGWALTSGNVAAPFHRGMLLPLLAYNLAGIPYYFAGMLTGMRQARWYVSRALGLGVGILVSISIISAPHFWQAILYIFIGTAGLALASWGSFHTNGFCRGQPAGGKPALIFVIALGWVPIAFLAGMLLGDLVSRLEPQTPGAPWSNYSMTKDGVLFKVTQAKGRPVQITDLEGNPAKDPRTGAPMTLGDLDRLKGRGLDAVVRTKERPRLRRWGNRLDMADLWKATPQTLWYYQADRGRLAGYDVRSRRFIGSLGPKGFAQDLLGTGDAFTGTSERTLKTDTGLFLPDLQNRSVKPFFTTEPQDAVVGADDVVVSEHARDYTLVLTRQFIRLVTEDGAEVLKTPFQPPSLDYSVVKLSVLEPRDQFALWLVPSDLANEKSGWKLPTLVTWFEGGRKKASTELPPAPREDTELDTRMKVVGLLMPPALIAVIPLLSDSPWSEVSREFWLVWRTLLFLSLVFAVAVGVPVGYWLTRRYSLPRSAQLGWSVFLLLSGFPGLLALLSVEEWPARESCPNCRKLRVVCREHCEHCGAKFASPEKKGTEIFELADRASQSS